jgi:hypothetical protein
MLEGLERRNYSHRIAKTYVRIVRDFAGHFQQPPDKLAPEQIRQYQAHLFQAKKLAPLPIRCDCTLESALIPAAYRDP